MEVKKMNCTTKSSSNDHDQKEKEEEEEEEEVILPGFRFHPTDEELVGFYLRRKIEKKPISIEIIKQADIYKYDPWDLPRVSTVGDKEWYFFCIRGRKYRNSIRPNRVTGSGFWKATGIDKPIHSLREPHACIGLKKSLVYYRGSAGKGTKTDWMMHEFRLPPTVKITNFSSPKDIAQEAEVWTLCRIFKRTPSYKKYTPNWKDSGVAAAANNGTKLNYKPVTDSSSKTCSSSVESETSCEQKQQYNYQQNETKPFIVSNQFEMINQRNQNDLLMSTTTTTTSHHHHHHQNQSQSPIVSASYSSSSPSLWSPNAGDHDFFRNGNWDELRSVVELAIDPTSHVYID